MSSACLRKATLTTMMQHVGQCSPGCIHLRCLIGLCQLAARGPRHDWSHLPTPGIQLTTTASSRSRPNLLHATTTNRWCHVKSVVKQGTVLGVGFGRQCSDRERLVCNLLSLGGMSQCNDGKKTVGFASEQFFQPPRMHFLQDDAR